VIVFCASCGPVCAAVLIIADDVNIGIAGVPVLGGIEVIAVPLLDKVVAVKIVGKGLIGVYPELLVSCRAFPAPPEP